MMEECNLKCPRWNENGRCMSGRRSRCVKLLQHERDLYRAGFLSAMEWYACDQDEIVRLSGLVSDDVESGMIDKKKGAEERGQLKAMWIAITANAGLERHPGAGEEVRHD